MRKLLLIAGVAALTLPGVALAQADCWHQQRDNRVAGTVVGAGVGALIGSSVAGPGSRGAGAVIGAIGGGAVGNAAAGSATDCAHYSSAGYYDANGVWRQSAGYYDANGNWIVTAPVTPDAGDYDADVAYTGPMTNIDAREDGIEQRIQNGDNSGALNRDDADRAFRSLADIRRQESHMITDHDGLNGDDRADLNSRLDDLDSRVSAEWTSTSGY